MKNLARQLPTVLGSCLAMLIAFLAQVAGASPTACVVKATFAFAVFAAIGSVLRFALSEWLVEDRSAAGYDQTRPRPDNLQEESFDLGVIPPGATVAELLGETTEDADAEGTSAARNR